MLGAMDGGRALAGPKTGFGGAKARLGVSVAFFGLTMGFGALLLVRGQF